jgi:hypothetical protein
MNEVNYFLKILKHQNPIYYSGVRITTEVKNIYGEPGINNIVVGKLRKIIIQFPGNSGNLYSNISSYIRFVWGTNDVIAEFDFDGTNYFKFTV